jgi:hypothetical protein
MSREGSNDVSSSEGVDELQDDFFIPEPMPDFGRDAIKQYTTLQLSDMCHMGEIDISPEYQRGKSTITCLGSPMFSEANWRPGMVSPKAVTAH